MRLEQDAGRQWKKFADRENSGGKPTGEARRVAVKGAVAAVISWLQRDDGLRDRVAAIGEPMRRKPSDERQDGGGPRPRPSQRTPEEEREFVQKHIIPCLAQEFGTSHMAEFQACAVQTHFWCELLAQTARALDECRGHYERAKQSVVDALASGNAPHPQLWALILPYQDMVHRAVDLVFEMLPRAAGLPAPEDVFELVWPVRVLACLMCKDPSKHSAVRKYCLNLILQWGQARVSDEICNRMGWTFPDEWPDQGSDEAGAA